jgi:hypothetical protein
MQAGTMFSFYPLNGQAATIQPVIVYTANQSLQM